MLEMAPKESRKYDIVVLGATGYTGALTAEHLTRHAPTNLRWALAGRSLNKLEALATKLKSINADRLQPALETISIDDQKALSNLMSNTKVCISVVSYASVGAFVVKACIESKTDYVDAEGNIPIQRRWYDEFHEKAVANGVRLIHACAMFSATQDLLSWVAIRELATKHSVETAEVILAVEEFPQEVSGGTMKALGERLTDPSAAAANRQGSEDPWYIATTKRGRSSSSSSSSSVPPYANAFGLRRDAHLGVLSASTISRVENRAVVHRTWSLLHGRVAGYNSADFRYAEYEKAASLLDGWMRVAGQYVVAAVLGSAVLYRLLKTLFPAEGDGPDPEKSRSLTVRLQVHAVAEAAPGETPRRVGVRFVYPGGPYLATAMFLAEGGLSLVFSDALEGGVTGGCLTPALLGGDLVRRITEAGARIEVSDV